MTTIQKSFPENWEEETPSFEGGPAEYKHGPIIDVEIWEYGLRYTYADGYVEDYLDSEEG